MAEHVWIKSELGHGETMCAKCMMTNREAAVLGLLDACEKADADVSRLCIGDFGHDMEFEQAAKNFADAINRRIDYAVAEAVKRPTQAKPE